MEKYSTYFEPPGPKCDDITTPQGHRISGFIACQKGTRYPSRIPDSFYARPTTPTVDRIMLNMLPIDNDTIYFEFIYFPGFVRIYAQHNQIIGSRIIADIDHNSIPMIGE